MEEKRNIGQEDCRTFDRKTAKFSEEDEKNTGHNGSRILERRGHNNRQEDSRISERGKVKVENLKKTPIE
jgi:hypothetical protein